MMSPPANSTRFSNRLTKKMVSVVVLLLMLVMCFILIHTISFDCSWCIASTENIMAMPHKLASAFGHDKTKSPGPTWNRPHFHPTCSKNFDASAENPLTALDNKYAHLMDDKFTVAIQTYKRPAELEITLDALLGTYIPSLHEVVVVWNNIDETPPHSYTSKHNVPVRYRPSQQNSLNQKLLPDPEYKTKAILLTDDDVHYGPEDLEFVFQAWRDYAQWRLVGGLPRCSDLNESTGLYEYGFCSGEEGKQHYSMILTNLCFAHIALLDYYWSDYPEARQIRDYVDNKFNCEDIALNYLASSLTGWGPLEANGFNRYSITQSERAISKKPGHFQERTQCLNDFVDIIGCQPLVDESAHIVRGMVQLNA